MKIDYTSKGRILGLDGLRTLSLALVVFAHWAPVESVLGFFETGRMGLVIFFTLSGFLITRILLDLRTEIDRGLRSKKSAIKEFYWRRSVRIFPIYYLAVAFVCISGFSEAVVRDIGWHLTFTANFSAAFLAPQGAYEPIGPLWSLCVEEQFYIFWAPCVLFLPRRLLPWIACVMIAAAIIFRVVGEGYLSHWQLVLSTPSNIDALAAGIMVALALNAGLYRHRSCRYLFGALAMAGIVGIFYIIANHGATAPLWTAYNDCAYYFVAASIIFFLATGSAKWIRQLFELRPIKFIGVRSYGFYVYHQIAHFTLLYPMGAFHYLTGIRIQRFSVEASILYFIGTFTLAVLSYKYLEKPLLDMREKKRIA